jgi:hypothetical protein
LVTRWRRVAAFEQAMWSLNICLANEEVQFNRKFH